MTGRRRVTTVLGWTSYGLGLAIWLIGYYTPGHPSLLDWPSYSPSWIAMFLQNLECELGLALTTLGTIAIYGVKVIPRGRIP